MKGSKHNKGRDARPRTPPAAAPSVLDSFRQWSYPPALRIPGADGEPQRLERPPLAPVGEAPPPPPPSSEAAPAAMARALADVATSLWYLKTRYFKRGWDSEDDEDPDPRVRRALGRLQKGIDALRTGGVELHDPVHQPYPPGGEALMRPIQFQPTQGLTDDRVTETVVPIVFFRDRIVQRGEVFVGVPAGPPAEGPGEPARATSEPAAAAPGGKVEGGLAAPPDDAGRAKRGEGDQEP